MHRKQNFQETSRECIFMHVTVMSRFELLTTCIIAMCYVLTNTSKCMTSIGFIVDQGKHYHKKVYEHHDTSYSSSHTSTDHKEHCQQIPNPVSDTQMQYYTSSLPHPTTPYIVGLSPACKTISKIISKYKATSQFKIITMYLQEIQSFCFCSHMDDLKSPIHFTMIVQWPDFSPQCTLRYLPLIKFVIMFASQAYSSIQYTIISIFLSKKNISNSGI